MKKKMSDKKFVETSKRIIKGLNDLSITNPEHAQLFNKVTDMLESKVKQAENTSKSIDNEEQTLDKTFTNKQ